MNLSQLADGVPDLLRDVQKYRVFPNSPDLDLNLVSPSLSLDQVSEAELASDISDFFDWDLYRGTQHQRLKSAGKSDVSMPGLTSATSEGSSSTNSDPEDRSQFKVKLREAKKDDDRLTLPPLKPKGGGISYQSQIQIDDTTQVSATSTSRKSAKNGTLPSPPSSRESSVGRSLPPKSNHRGRRTGPLKDADDVAEVRSLGACLRCKYRKVKCDHKEICDNCVEASNVGSEMTLPVEHMCIRKLFANDKFVFPVIAKTEAGRPSTGSRSQQDSRQLQVYFGTVTPLGQALTLPVVLREDILENGLVTGQHQEDIYRLDLDKINQYLSESNLCKWAAEWNLNHGSSDFQAALDNLTVMCTSRGAPCFPSKQFEILRKVHRMRCLFKVWSQRNFFYTERQTPYRKLPPTLQSGLRQIAKSAMKRLEGEICKDLAKSMETKLTKPADRLPIWISMMQMIMLYRELHNRTESAPTHRPGVRPPSSWQFVLHLTKDLFNTLVHMCAVCFEKKQPAPLATDGDHHKKYLQEEVNKYFSAAIDCRHSFYESLNPQPGSLDQILYVRLATCSKTASSKPAKRQKHS